jgi:hypothetical protein
MMDEKNIFEIWEENGEKTSFAVRRRNWATQYYTIVVEVVINKWPYGDAFGYTTVNGTYSNHYDYDKRWRESRIIPCCGCYQWTLVENPRIDELDYQQFMKQFSLRKTTAVENKKSVDTFQLTYDLLKKNLSIEKIAKERQFSPSTIYSHIGKLISHNYPIDFDRIVPKEKQERIITIASSLGDEKLKPLKEYLGVDFSYNEIRLIIISNKKLKKKDR